MTQGLLSILHFSLYLLLVQSQINSLRTFHLSVHEIRGSEPLSSLLLLRRNQRPALYATWKRPLRWDYHCPRSSVLNGTLTCLLHVSGGHLLSSSETHVYQKPGCRCTGTSNSTWPQWKLLIFIYLFICFVSLWSHGGKHHPIYTGIQVLNLVTISDGSSPNSTANSHQVCYT